MAKRAMIIDGKKVKMTSEEYHKFERKEQSELFVNGVVKAIKKRFEVDRTVKIAIDDLLSSLDGYMTEEEIGAMVVDIMILLLEDDE